MTVKIFIILHKISIFNKCCSVHQRILKNNESLFPLIYCAAQLFLTLIIIRNISLAANQHISLITDGPCDTEDWSNDAEISGLNYSNKLDVQYIHI